MSNSSRKRVEREDTQKKVDKETTSKRVKSPSESASRSGDAPAFKLGSVYLSSILPSAASESRFSRGSRSAQPPSKPSGAAELFTEPSSSSKSSSKSSKESKKRAGKEDKTRQKYETARSFSLSELSPGTHVLGVIVEVLPLSLSVSLPNQRFGFVKAKHISHILTEKLEAEDGDGGDGDADHAEDELPQLTDLFSRGQLVYATVLKSSKSEKTGKSRISLSLCPSHVNQSLDQSLLAAEYPIYACVQSHEDRGYVLSLGNPSFSAFLSHSNIPDSAPPLHVGQPVMCELAEKPRPKRTLQLSLKTAVPPRALSPKIVDKLPVSAFKPGLLLSVTILAKNKSGTLFAKICDNITAEIPRRHYATSPQNLEAGSSVFARVLYADLPEFSDRPRIALTLLPHLLHSSSFFFPPHLHLSDTLTSCTVTAFSRGYGVTLSIPSSDAHPVTGFIPSSHMFDKDSSHPSPEAHFAPGAKIRARILNFDCMEGLVMLTSRPQLLQEPYLRYTDVPVGAAVKGKIFQVLEAGVVVRIGTRIVGFCPADQLADIPISHPPLRFKPSEALRDFRVLYVDPTSKKVTLTKKQTLLESPYPPIVSSSIPVGTIAHGTITAVRPTGLSVRFYGQMKGWIPLKHLTLPTDDPNPKLKKYFQPLRPILVTVLFVKSAKELVLSTKIHKNNQNNGQAAVNVGLFDEVTSSLHHGDFVSAVVASVGPSSIFVHILDPSDADKQSTPVYEIPAAHLTDLPISADKILPSFYPNQRLDDLLVLHKSKSKIAFTFKPLLRLAHHQNLLPSTWADIAMDRLVTGVVTQITASNCTVSFLQGMVGMVLKRDILDEFVPDLSAVLSVGQTVIARVSSLDEDRYRFLLCLRPSVCQPRSDQETIFSDYFARCFFAHRDLLPPSSPASSDSPTLLPGTMVPATVLEVHPYATMFSVASDFKGVALPFHLGDGNKSFKVGSSHQARILDIDAQAKILDLSLHSRLVASDSRQKRGKSSSERKLKANASYTGTVELVKSDYVVISTLLQGQLVLGYATLIGPNTSTPISLPLSLGQTVSFRTVPSSPDPQLTHRNVFALLPPKDGAVTASIKISSLGDVKLGMTLPVRVKRIATQFLYVALGIQVMGRIHLTEIEDPEVCESHSNAADLFKRFQVGQMLNARVIAVADEGEDRYLPISQTNPKKHTVIDLTLRPHDLALPPNAVPSPRPSFQTIQEGDRQSGFIHRIEKDVFWVMLGPRLRGRVFILDSSDSLEDLKHFTSLNQPGRKVITTVLDVNPDSKHLDLSIRDPLPLEVGQVVNCRVILPKKRAPTSLSLKVMLPCSRWGKINILDVADEYKPNPFSGFQDSMIIPASVLTVSQHKSCKLSLRPSRLHPELASTPVDPELSDISDLKVGSHVRGYVYKSGPAGVFVAITRGFTALSPPKLASKKLVQDWAKTFPKGLLVRGLIVKVDAEKQSCLLNLKSATNIASEDNALTFEDLKPRQIVKAKVMSIQPYGIFIKIDKSNVSGICHHSRLLDIAIDKSEIANNFAVGDRVKALIVSIDSNKRRVEFSLKPSDLTSPSSSSNSVEDDDSSQSEDDSDEEVDRLLNDQHHSDLSDDQIVTDDDDDDDDDDSDDDSDDDDNEDDSNSDEEDDQNSSVDDDNEDNSSGNSSSDESDDDDENLLTAGAFSSTIDWTDLRPDSSESTSLPSLPSSSRPDPRAIRAEEQQEIQRIERSVRENLGPQTPSDFEQLLAASPDSSYLWIRYMAYYMTVNEPEKSRALAKRALKKISSREEKEKFNIWLAWLNLEMACGTSDEEVMKLFQAALPLNDPKQLHFHFFESVSRIERRRELAEQVLKIMLRKFRQSKGAWLRAISYYFQTQKADQARSLFSQAIVAVPERKRVSLSLKTCQYEYKFGAVERGRTMFEQILSNYPKRLDIWSIYLDLELARGDIENLRNIFERATDLKLSSKKMRFMLKRFLAFEQEHGTPSTIQHVKQKTLRYIESK